jgi:hypothetical protein
MRTFTPIIWLVTGQVERFPGLTDKECFKREMAIAIKMDPTVRKTECVQER